MPIQRVLRAGTTGALEEYIAKDVSTGAADAGNLVALNPAGQLDPTMLPAGIGPDVQVVVASEAIAAGCFVNVYGASGAFRMRKADASAAGKEATGFVLDAVAATVGGTVYLAGLNTALTSLAPGRVFLSATTPGGVAATPPAGAGQTVQQLGTAVSATAVQFQPGPAILRA